MVALPHNTYDDSMNPKSWPILVHIESIDSNEPILAPK